MSADDDIDRAWEGSRDYARADAVAQQIVRSATVGGDYRHLARCYLEREAVAARIRQAEQEALLRTTREDVFAILCMADRPGNGAKIRFAARALLNKLASKGA